MNLSLIAGYLSGIVFAISGSWYVFDVAKKKVTASIATFFMFVIINISQLSSLIAEHVWHVVPFTLIGLASSVLVCLLAIRSKKIYVKWLDIVGFVGSAIGFVVWLITRDAAYNLYIISIVNLIVFIPLIAKTYFKPELETLKPWQLNLAASFILLLTINSTSAYDWIVPVRQFICSLALNVCLFRGAIIAKKAIKVKA